jgi:hypothetical protein
MVEWRQRLFRLGAAVAGLLILVAAGLAPFAWWQWRNAERAAARAMEAERMTRTALESADNARQEAIEAGNRITENLALRQEILSGRIERRHLSENARVIEFKATRKEYPYKAVGGRPTYNFQIFPVKASIPHGWENIAFITYMFDHPTFLNTLITAGRDRDFTASYDGVACLTNVIALVEYTDPNKRPLVSQFNMCELTTPR